MKICIIGAGSTYTPELVEGIINKRDTLPVTHLVFMDIDERKLNIVGSLCQRMIEAAGLPCKTRLVLNDYETALKGADFVLAQIRVGKLPARVKDEKIPLKYNLIGQETCGIGGMFKGLRTIPVMMNIVKLMEKHCPDAWLINFSNPSGMIAEAVLNNTKIKMMGLCNVPINTIESLKKKMELPNAEIEYIGLNHLAWVTAIRQDGKDYLQEAINAGINSEVMKNIPASGFTQDLIKTVGAIPTCYLEYYYYKEYKYKKTYEYKLIQTGYTKDEIKIFDKYYLSENLKWTLSKFILPFIVLSFHCLFLKMLNIFFPSLPFQRYYILVILQVLASYILRFLLFQ